MLSDSFGRLMTRPLAIAVGLLLGVVGVGAAALMTHRQTRSDYETFTAKSESELIHAAGRVTSVSNHMPFVEIRFGDGRSALATFVTFPIYKGKSLYVRDTGPFDSSLLPVLPKCKKTDFELLSNPDSLTSYWIYAVTCDGVSLLGYSQTINYLHAQELRVDR
ncbi:hypothetical protein PQR66_14185 [Paraburkholderia agricolaris]|uniref:Uncharacterized protein n=1 Tax=Paraburkholderia agricolaris TaxID=2152888 RepID=A0ABW8ZMG9_9BURK